MNRKLDGEELTHDDLLQIALDNNLSTPEKLNGLAGSWHNERLAQSQLNTLTQEVRFTMWSRGELLLDTRDKYNSRWNA